MLICRKITTFGLCACFLGMCHLTSKFSHGFEDDTLIKWVTSDLPINLPSANLQWKRNKC